jgi:predicted O-methyltransferase YrrM
MLAIDYNMFFKMFKEVAKVEEIPFPAATNKDVNVLQSLVHSFQCKSFFETGLNLGHTARRILKYSPFIEKYIGVDLPYEQKEATFGAQSFEVPEKPGCMCNDPRLRVMLRPYGVKNIDPIEVGKFDFIFIDGDHSTEGIKVDTEFCEKILNPNGIIAWHDFSGMREVSEFIEAYSDVCDNRIWWVRDTYIAFRIGRI